MQLTYSNFLQTNVIFTKISFEMNSFQQKLTTKKIEGGGKELMQRFL
jgi:hypothetical protein